MVDIIPAKAGIQIFIKEMENNKVINSNCWVAYFDILGFRNNVEHFPAEGVLEEYRKVLKEIERHNVNCKFFSDSFVFYTENDSEDSFRRIDAALKFFFSAMFNQYIPMRGCLNVGHFYVDEEKGIFLGRSLVEAHDLAEGQNWVGFILSEKVGERLYDFNAKDSKLYRDELKKHYVEYQVPFKKKMKRSLLVFNLTIDPYLSNAQAQQYQSELLNSLDTMKYISIIHLRKRMKSKELIGLKKCHEYKNVNTKYKNTKDFLLYVYPTLKGKVGGKQR